MFTLVVVAIAIFVLSILGPYYGLSSNILSRICLILVMLAALFALTIVHEGAHFIFQWLFSRKMPKIGFKKGNPYCALAANVRVTRNQSIFITSAPLILIPLLLVVACFFSGIYQLVIITLALLELASCAGDILKIKWLLKYPRNTWVENINLVNTLFTKSR